MEEAVRQRDDCVIAQLLRSPGASESLPLPPGAPALDESHQQSRDDAALLSALQDSPAAAGQAVPPSASQQRRDDAVLSQILFGETPKGSSAEMMMPSHARQRGRPRWDPRERNGHRRSGFHGAGGRAWNSQCETSQDRDDWALAEVLGQVPLVAEQSRRGPQDDDQTLSLLLASALEEKRSAPGFGVVPHSPLLSVVEEVLRGARAERGWLLAEVVAGGHGRGDALHQLSRPLGIAVDAHGAVIVADNGNGRVVRWPAQATEGQVISDADRCFRDPFGVAVDFSGSLVVSSGASVFRTSMHSVGGDSQVVLTGAWPTGLAVDSDGSLLVADAFDHGVARCCLPGAQQHLGDVETIVGENGTGARREQLHRPFGVAALADGSVLIVDSGNHRVVRWERGARRGVVVAGGNGRGARPDQLSYPRSVVVDEAGHLLVADTLNHRVVCWAPGASSGKVIAGGRGQGGRIDQLSKPAGLALDGNSLLVADSGNHRVVRWPLPHCGARAPQRRQQR
eukprot:TRINITY_DN30842_c0_g2_i1.p1 TRINITY_DN30842_c0_g2~~TRINITY_DN30842_c0_g2_i1.p1  ORF type:complete len:597 (-),score=108.65 TRINITY_DN30842_c0_g2_i1:159-1691(-)